MHTHRNTGACVYKHLGTCIDIKMYSRVCTYTHYIYNSFVFLCIYYKHNKGIAQMAYRDDYLTNLNTVRANNRPWRATE